MHLLPGDPDEGADGVKAMDGSVNLPRLAPAAPTHSCSLGRGDNDLAHGTVSVANFRVSSQTLLGLRRVTVLPPEGFFWSGLITTV